MIIYCRDCLLDGISMADSPSHGTIHEGKAVCIRHLKRQLAGVLAQRVQDPGFHVEDLTRV